MPTTRVTADWHGAGCELRGAIFEGHVLSVVPYAKPEKISEVGLAFSNNAQWLGHEMGGFDLLLAAIEALLHGLDLGVLTDPETRAIGSTVRLICAVLLDTETRQITRTARRRRILEPSRQCDLNTWLGCISHPPAPGTK